MTGLPEPTRAVPVFSRLRTRVGGLAEVAKEALGYGAHPQSSEGQGPTVPRPGSSEPLPLAERVAHDPLMALVRGLPEPQRRQALTHSSWVTERTGSYERLEFLGDSVLGLVVAAELYERHPDREEGDLARFKAFVVSRQSCAQVAERLGVSALILEEGPAPEKKRREAAAGRTILGNVLEALIGACYLNYGLTRTAEAVVAAFAEQFTYVLTSHVDHKTRLQEILAPSGLQPVYRLVSEEGPPHARVFASQVLVDDRVRGQGEGTTIKRSEQAAAERALASLAAEEGGG